MNAFSWGHIYRQFFDTGRTITVENDNGVKINMFILNFMKPAKIIYAFSSF